MEPGQSNPLSELSPDQARRVDAVCRDFEASWSPGRRPRIEDLLPPDPGPLRDALAFELIALELELRRNAGECATVAEYVGRFSDQDDAIARAFAEAQRAREQATAVAEAATVAPPAGARDATMHHPGSAEAPVSERIHYFGDYEVLGEIARGGMGVVYRARQISLNRPVALKMILAGQLADETEVKRFRLEAEAAAGLEHPAIVSIYEAGEHLGQHYFSMGFVEGSSLAQKVADSPLPPREAAMLVQEVAQAIQYAHDRGVIHRDLKPQNVLLDKEGRPRITDFGLARKVESGEALTASGAVMGTPGYMPPEQASGDTHSVGPPADIYSLGAVLYCLLTGRPPFQSSSAMATLLQVLEREPVAPRELNPAVDLDLETICLKCLQKDIHRRYARASDLADDLGRWLRGEPIVARPVSRTERAWRWCRRNPIVARLLATLFVVLAGVAGGSLWAAIRFRDDAARQEHLRIVADTASAAAQKQRALAEAKSAESQQRLSQQLVSNGNLPRAEGDPLAALPWYADALEVDSDGRERSPLHRLRVSATLRKIPRLVGLARMPLGPSESVAFAPEGLRLVGGADGVVTTIDPLTGGRHDTHLDLPRPVGDFRLSPDGRLAVRVAAGLPANPKQIVYELLAWDVAGNRAVGPAIKINVPGQYLGLSLAFRPDGRRLVTWGVQGPLRTWDLASGREAAPAISTRLHVQKVVYSQDGRLFAAIMSTTTIDPHAPVLEFLIQIFDSETGGPQTPPIAHPAPIVHAAFNVDGTRLVTLTSLQLRLLGEARVWDTASGKLVLGPLNHGEVQTGSVSVVAFSPDGQRLVTGGLADARIWDIARAKSSVRAAPLPGGAVAVAFSPDGRMLATLSGREKVARVWDAGNLEPLSPPLRQAGAASSIRFSADGRLLVTVGSSPAPRELESRAWDLTGAPPGSGRSLPGRWSDPDGRLLVRTETSSVRVQRKTVEQVSLQVVKRADGSPAAPSLVVGPSRRSNVLHAALSARGNRLIAVVAPSLTARVAPVRIWDLRAEPPAVAELKQAHAVTFVVLSPDDHRAATVAGSDRRAPGAVWLWDLASKRGKPLALDAKRTVLCAAFSPDGHRVLTVQDGLARLWDAATGASVGPPVTSARPPSRSARLVRYVVEGRHMPSCGAFTPDGQVALVSIGDAAVHRLDSESGESLSGGPVLTREEAGVVAVSGAGRRFITQLADGTAQVWDVQTGGTVGPPLAPVVPEWQISFASRSVSSRPAVALSADGRIALTSSGTEVHVWEAETGLPLGPPLQATAAVERVLLCDAATVVAFTRSDAVETWDLSPDATPDRDLVRLSGLLSGRRITPDGAIASVSADDLGRAWSDLHGRQRELPEQPAESALEWHGRKAQEFESTGDPFAAVVHLDPLVAAAPDDLNLRKRRADAAAELGRWAAAAADFAVILKRRPDDAEARISLALLSARLGDRDTYRSACTTLMAPIKKLNWSPTTNATFHVATLRADGLDDPEALVKLLDGAAKYYQSDPGFHSTLACAQFRAGHLEAARQSARESIAAYSRGSQSARLPGQRAEDVLRAEDVGPERDAGTPREWLLMALVEAKLGHGDAATAWRSKAVGWLLRAAADRTDPEVLGVMNVPWERMIIRRMQHGPLMNSFRFDYKTMRRFVPTWRQLIELELLRGEADEAATGSARRAAPGST
jgi:WD40 repeat protein